MPLPQPELKKTDELLALLPEEWEAQVQAWGQPKYRGRQIFTWIYKHGVMDPMQMKNVPKALRERLIEEGLNNPLTTTSVTRATDATRKLLVKMHDDELIETVLLPQLKKNDPDLNIDIDEHPEVHSSGMVPSKVVTQCISSQVGCAMGCVFCASGVAGLKRHMTAGQIVAQVLEGQKHLDEGEAIRNIVFMGMGEPLHNYDEVARALVLLTHEDGLALSNRRVTISTSGLVPQIDRLGKDFEGRVQLAISLHSVDDKKRSEIMPINRKHDLKNLIECLKRYPLPRRRRITIEYTLIKGVNDTMQEADALVKLLSDVPTKVNLIPMNPIDGSDLGAPTDDTVLQFKERLNSKGLMATIRKTRGDKLAAACGQLAFRGVGPRTKRSA